MESVTNGVELPAPYPLAKQHKAIVPGKASSRLIVAQFRSYVRELSNFFHMQLNCVSKVLFLLDRNVFLIAQRSQRFIRQWIRIQRWMLYNGLWILIATVGFLRKRNVLF